MPSSESTAVSAAADYAANFPSLFQFILSKPVAANWLLDRKPIATIPSQALQQSVGFKVIIVPLENGARTSTHTGVTPNQSLGETYEVGTKFLITPMFEEGGVACGAFFGDQAPPVAGGWSKPVACSRWATDMRYNVLFQCTWFEDSSLYCMVFRVGVNWTKEVFLFKPFAEGSPPPEPLVQGRLYDRRDCEECQAKGVNCIHSPIPDDLDPLYSRPVEAYPGGSMTASGFCGNFVSARTGQFTTVAEFRNSQGYSRSLLHNLGIRFNEIEEELNRSSQLKEAGYYGQPESASAYEFRYAPADSATTPYSTNNDY